MKRFSIHQIHERTGYIVYLVYDEVMQSYRGNATYSRQTAVDTVQVLNAPYIPASAQSTPQRSLAA